MDETNELKEMPTKVHFQNILEALDGFEEKNKDFVVQSELNGWNEWSVLKKPLFYLLKNTNYGLAKGNSVKDSANWIKWIMNECAFFCRLLYYTVTKRKNDVIVTSTGNRLSKGEDGLYTEVFIDPLIYSGAIKKYLYLEYSNYTIAAKPSKVNVHIRKIGRNLFVILLHRWYGSRPKFKNKSREWAKKLNSFFEGSSPVNVSEKDISEIFANFYAHYRWNRFLYKILKPERLFFVDGIPKGAMAAARDLKIRIYEFQHGFISNNKADYIVTNEFLACKNKMVIPDRICVFGDYFRDLLLKNGFWKKEEVVALGSYVIEKMRSSFSYQIPAPGQPIRVLWTTQPTIFQQSKEWLEKLKIFPLDRVKFFLKTHPLEPKTNVEWYHEFVENNKGRFEAEEASDLFSALRQKQLLVGFHSTALLEAISIGTPVITLSTSQFPKGINSLLDIDISNVVRPVNTAEQLCQLISTLRDDAGFCQNWSKESFELGSFFFSNNYYNNIEQYFK